MALSWIFIVSHRSLIDLTSSSPHLNLLSSRYPLVLQLREDGELPTQRVPVGALLFALRGDLHGHLLALLHGAMHHEAAVLTPADDASLR